VTNPPADNPDNPNIPGDRDAADDTQAVPPVDRPQPESHTSAQPGAAAPGARLTAWYRRLPGRPWIWLAALALVAACVIGCCGFVAGAVVSHGGEHGISRNDRWGNDRHRGDDGGDNGRERGPERRPGKIAPPPAPPGTVVPTPAVPTPPQTSAPTPTQPPAPSPTA
jgi:hypothetical protein